MKVYFDREAACTYIHFDFIDFRQQACRSILFIYNQGLRSWTTSYLLYFFIYSNYSQQRSEFQRCSCYASTPMTIRMVLVMGIGVVWFNIKYLHTRNILKICVVPKAHNNLKVHRKLLAVLSGNKLHDTVKWLNPKMSMTLAFPHWKRKIYSNRFY